MDHLEAHRALALLEALVDYHLVVKLTQDIFDSLLADTHLLFRDDLSA